MAEQITPAEGGGILGAIVFLIGAVTQGFRTAARADEARRAAARAEERAEAAEESVKRAIETMEGRIAEGIRAAKAEISGAARSSRSGIAEEVIEQIVRGQLRELDARIESMADRLGEVIGAVKVLTGAPDLGHRPPTSRGRH